MKRWNSKPLSEVAINISRPFKAKNNKAIFLNTGDVLEGVFLHRDYSSIKNMPGQAKKGLIEGDILFSEIRPGNKRFAFVDFDPQDYIVSTKFMVIRPLDEKVLLPSFLYLILTQDNNLEYCQLIAESRSGTFPQITFDSIDNIEVPLPSMDYQKRITSFKKQFDEKIELNRQMNRTLEQMARALFKSWFIDFDPVHAKQRGEQPADMDAETAALFPDRFEQIDGKEVPEGWRIGELADIIEFNPSLKLPKGADSTYLDMGSMPTQGASANGWFKRPFSSGSKYQNGDTLFARITPCLENGKAAFVDFLESNEVGWGSTEYIVMRPKSATPTILPYMLSRNENFRDFAIANMNGSSGRQRVSHQSLSRYPTVIPSREIFDAFERVTRPVLTFSKVARDESNRLAEIRDSLLPRLLSGELDVSDWENAVEDPEGAPA